MKRTLFFSVTLMFLLGALKFIGPEQVNQDRPDYIVEATYPAGKVHAVELRPIGKGQNIVVYSSLPYTIKPGDTCRAEVILTKVEN